MAYDRIWGDRRWAGEDEWERIPVYSSGGDQEGVFDSVGVWKVYRVCGDWTVVIGKTMEIKKMQITVSYITVTCIFLYDS